MIRGDLFKVFAPLPCSFLRHPFKIPGIPDEHLFCPAQGWYINLLYRSRILIVLQVLYPFQTMSGFMSRGTWILFMVQIASY